MTSMTLHAHTTHIQWRLIKTFNMPDDTHTMNNFQYQSE